MWKALEQQLATSLDDFSVDHEHLITSLTIIIFSLN